MSGSSDATAQAEMSSFQKNFQNQPRPRNPSHKPGVRGHMGRAEQPMTFRLVRLLLLRSISTPRLSPNSGRGGRKPRAPRHTPCNKRKSNNRAWKEN